MKKTTKGWAVVTKRGRIKIVYPRKIYAENYLEGRIENEDKILPCFIKFTN